MGVTAKAGPTFAPAPAGQHAAVCIDIVDLGVLKTVYNGVEKKQHKIKIVWQIDAARDDGKPFHLSKRYTNSLHEKASLRKDLEAWRGKAFTEQELEGFDLDKLLGVPAMLSAIQVVSKGTTYTNVNAIMRLHKQITPPVPDPTYVRVQDRPPEDGTENDRSNYPDDRPTPPDWDDAPAF